MFTTTCSVIAIARCTSITLHACPVRREGPQPVARASDQTRCRRRSFSKREGARKVSAGSRTTPAFCSILCSVLRCIPNMAAVLVVLRSFFSQRDMMCCSRALDGLIILGRWSGLRLLALSRACSSSSTPSGLTRQSAAPARAACAAVAISMYPLSMTTVEDGESWRNNSSASIPLSS